MTNIEWTDEEEKLPDWFWIMMAAEKHNITAFREDIEAFVKDVQAAEKERIACKVEEMGMQGFGTLAIAAAIRMGKDV